MSILDTETSLKSGIDVDPTGSVAPLSPRLRIRVSSRRAPRSRGQFYVLPCHHRDMYLKTMFIVGGVPVVPNRRADGGQTPSTRQSSDGASWVPPTRMLGLGRALSPDCGFQSLSQHTC
jgi:hypothetical protein